MFQQRLQKLYAALQEASLDAIVLNPSPTQRYLTGLSFHLMERPTVLILAPGHQPIFILANLETSRLAQAAFPIHAVSYGDNPATWPEAFARAAALMGKSIRKIGVEPNWLRFLELKYLESAFPQAQWVNAEGVVSALRMQKDEQEIALMRRAVEITQKALIATLPIIHPGITENQIAAELVNQILRHGADTHLPFAPIVAAGPNSANPHATPTNRPIQQGDLLVVDWGATCEGYFSDLTRTFAIGRVDDELSEIARIVQQANQAGREAGRPGIAAGQVDRQTRKIIADAGYGAYFTHRTGHGLGLEDHEPPYIFTENDLLLATGMTYTIEPGIYLPGRGGVRIEDDVVVTADGCESLSDLPRELMQL